MACLAAILPFQVVLEFMVPWSELCKFMSRAVEELAKTYENDAVFYSLDTDKFKVRTMNGIRSDCQDTINWLFTLLLHIKLISLL